MSLIRLAETRLSGDIDKAFARLSRLGVLLLFVLLCSVNLEHCIVGKKLRLRAGWLSGIPRAKYQPVNWMRVRVRGEQLGLVRDQEKWWHKNLCYENCL